MSTQGGWHLVGLEKLLESLRKLFFESAVSGVVVGSLHAEVVLVGDAVWSVMGVDVPFPMAQPRSPFVVAVAQMLGDRNQFPLGHVLSGCEYGRRCGVAFGGKSQIDDQLGKGELAFGEANELARLHRGDGKQESLRIGVADVFASEDYESSAQKPNVFATFQGSC